MAATVPIVVPTVAEAAAAFLDTCTAPGTRRSYTQTMTRLITGHGTAPVTALDGETLRELLTTSWDGAALILAVPINLHDHGDTRSMAGQSGHVKVNLRQMLRVPRGAAAFCVPRATCSGQASPVGRQMPRPPPDGWWPEASAAGLAARFQIPQLRCSGYLSAARFRITQLPCSE